MAKPSFQKPRWLRDLLRFLPLKSQFVLSGNIRDLQAVEIAPETITPQSFELALGRSLREMGYGHIVLWTPTVGFQCLALPGLSLEGGDALLQTFGLVPDNGIAMGGIDILNTVLPQVVAWPHEPIALVVDFASRLSTNIGQLSAAEHQLFTQALVLSQQAKSRPATDSRQPFLNTILWLVEKEGDLPDWLVVNNPKLRHIPVAKPDNVARRTLAPALLRGLSGFAEANDDVVAKAQNDFVEQTEGLLLLDMSAIATLARVEQVPMVKIGDAVRRYKVGVTEDPWQKIDREKIQDGEHFIHRRVKGQDHATTHVLDIIKRAITGVGNSKKGNRPRGVVFLAGPTGVGKTELAKTMTSLLFGDEEAYIRFDMSEFSAEHADQRLIGAPPGYVGYDMGGELTNAIREKPFSVVLFDEIEKAHPRILDKFLQILDDGVLTSGRGDRVYFSETLIVFTSNLGIYKLTETGERVSNVSAKDDYPTVKNRVLSEIDKHFKLVLNRPEILNRIGENIIVFDFIRPDVAMAIFGQMIDQILADLSEQGLSIAFADTALLALQDLVLADLSNGGRGIRNQIEAHLLNPLARALFACNPQVGEPWQIAHLAEGELTLTPLLRE